MLRAAASHADLRQIFCGPKLKKLNKLQKVMRKLTIALLLLAALVSVQAFAIPAHRGQAKVPQPDGTLLTIELVGDEFYHYNTTIDGCSCYAAIG